MTTFIQAKLKKSDDQTNIDKYKTSAHNLLQNIIFCRFAYAHNLFFPRIIISKIMAIIL